MVVFAWEPAVLQVPKSQESDDTYRRLTKSMTIIPAQRFVPQDSIMTPEEHFPLQTIATRAPWPRFVNRFNSREIMLAADGSCVNNGRHADKSRAPEGGCAFFYKASSKGGYLGTIENKLTLIGDQSFVKGNTLSGKISFRMEQRGPTGEMAEHTSNRAKLRAVIAALQFRTWSGEGWTHILVLTDLEYIVQSATQNLPRWVRNRWRKKPSASTRRLKRQGLSPALTGSGTASFYKYANRDLWEELQGVADSLRGQEVQVAFWLVPPGSRGAGMSRYIAETKAAAREAARRAGVVQEEEFTKLCGMFL